MVEKWQSEEDTEQFEQKAMLELEEMGKELQEQQKAGDEKPLSDLGREMRKMRKMRKRMRCWF